MKILACFLFLATMSAEAGTKGVATASAAGIDQRQIDTLDADIAAGKYPLVDGMLVIRCGDIVFQRTYQHDYGQIYGRQARVAGPLNARLSGEYNYFDAKIHPYYQHTDQHTMQSVTKTITSIVYGVAVTRGDFKAGLDTPVLGYFAGSDVRDVDDRKRRMTLRHLLTMSAGLDWDEELPYDDPRNSAILMEAADDWIKFVIDRPMASEPGSTFVYSSGVSELLSYIFQRETGQDIETYAKNNLFGPLNIVHYHWKRNPRGLVDTEGGLYLRATDLAKFGDLYMQRGMWNGKRIVSEDWVRQSVEPRLSVGEARFAKADVWKYGYQWWLQPHREDRSMLWAARGFGGQNLLVFPESNLIVVLTGWNILGSSSIEHDAIEKLATHLQPHDCGPRIH